MYTKQDKAKLTKQINKLHILIKTMESIMADTPKEQDGSVYFFGKRITSETIQGCLNVLYEMRQQRGFMDFSNKLDNK